MNRLVKDKPMPSAKIMTLYEVLKKFNFIFTMTDGIYYLLDDEGYEDEPLVFTYDWLVDKFKEDPKRKVSFYPSKEQTKI